MCGTNEKQIKQSVHLWMKDIMLKEGITEYEAEISGNSENGDGYVGEITFVKVTGTTDSGKSREFNYVIKSGKMDGGLRKEAPVTEAYVTEMFFYNKIYPVYMKFQKDYNIEAPFNNLPKCLAMFHHNGTEIIILENLKKIGFELHDRKKAMNLDHLKIIYKHYGILHGISFAIKEKNRELFDELSSGLHDVSRQFLTKSKLVQPVLDIFQESYSLFEGNEEIINQLNDIKKRLPHIFSDYLDEAQEKVIIHGDCWNNNFMFKYGNNPNSPIDLCILDWQCSTLTTPVRDLSYNLYACASSTELSHLDELLRCYHDSLSSFLRQVGLDPEKIFPFTQLKDQWRKYSIWGLIVSIFVLRLALCDSEEAPDLTAACNKEDGIEEMFKFEMKSQELYNERVRGIIEHYFSQK